MAIGIKSLADSHPYLFSQALGVILLLVLVIFKKQTTTILLSGLMAIPQAFYRLILVPEYWNPESIFVSKSGIEDFTFCFFAGAGPWIGILLYYNKKISVDRSILPVIKRYLFITITGVIIIAILYLFKVRGILNPFVTMIIGLLIVLIYGSS